MADEAEYKDEVADRPMDAADTEVSVLASRATAAIFMMLQP